MITILLILNLLNGNPQMQLYPETGIVTVVDYEANSVVYVNCNGNASEFYGCEDWSEKDLVAVIKCDNGTPEIYDDFIIGHPLYAGRKEWLPSTKETKPDLYPDCGVISSLDYESGWCFYTNGNGRPVPFYAEDDGFIMGELVSAIIDGKGTATFDDDIVIMLKGSGMIENFGGELLTAGE